MAATMLSVTAPKYTAPSGYELSTLPRPSIVDATDILIKVHAASINPIDVKKADGAFSRIIKDE
jgi:NADPH:quinone reductase-like Zn-dependent oxidoreductase